MVQKGEPIKIKHNKWNEGRIISEASLELCTSTQNSVILTPEDILLENYIIMNGMIYRIDGQVKESLKKGKNVECCYIGNYWCEVPPKIKVKITNATLSKSRKSIKFTFEHGEEISINKEKFGKAGIEFILEKVLNKEVSFIHDADFQNHILSIINGDLI